MLYGLIQHKGEAGSTFVGLAGGGNILAEKSKRVSVRRILLMPPAASAANSWGQARRNF
jgi:hypothetical protein